MKGNFRYKGSLLLLNLLLLLYGILIHCSSPAFSDNEFLAFSNTKSRAFAMGGAYISVEDDISSAAWNPAAFGSSEPSRTLLVYPFAPFIAINDFRNYDRSWRRDNELTFKESVLSLAFSMKGFAVSFPNLSIAVLGLEENPDSTGPRFFSSEAALKDHFHIVGVNIKPSPSLSFGVALRFYYRQEEDQDRKWGRGTNFGILLKPNPKVNIGIAYFDLPKSFLGEVDKRLVRIDDETVNAGISYYPNNRIALSVDLRNLNDESGLAQREIHLGFESKLLPKILVLRGGYFRKQPGDLDVFSLGFGWAFVPYITYLSGRDVLEYSFLNEETKYGKTRWHVFSFKINI